MGRRGIVLAVAIGVIAVSVAGVVAVAARDDDDDALDTTSVRLDELAGQADVPSSMAGAGSTMWVVGSGAVVDDDDVHGVDVATGEPVADVVVEGAEAVPEVAAWDGDLWVLLPRTSGTSELLQVDASTGEVVATVAIDGARYVGAGASGAWTLGFGGAVHHVAPASAEAVAVAQLSEDELGSPRGVVVADETVVLFTDLAVVTLGPDDPEPVVLPIAGAEHVGSGLVTTAVGADGVVWAQYSSLGALVRLDPATGTLTFGEHPGDGDAVIAGTGALWLTDSGIGADDPGRTTRVVELDPVTGAERAVSELDVGFAVVATVDGTAYALTDDFDLLRLPDR